MKAHVEEFRRNFESASRERKVEVLDQVIEWIGNEMAGVFSTDPSAALNQVKAISSKLQLTALLHAAKAALREGRNNSPINAVVFFDIFEWMFGEPTEIEKRAILASAWSVGRAQGRNGLLRSNNPYGGASSELANEWAVGWSEESGIV